MLLAILPFAAFVPVFIDDVGIGLQALDLRFRIKPSIATGNECLFDELNRADRIAPFFLWKKRMPLALEQPDVRVVTHNQIKGAVSAGLFGEAHMPGVKPIVASGCDYLFSPGG